MSGTITRIATAAAAPPLTPIDLARVHVELTSSRGRTVPLGTAARALKDRRLSAAERAAITALVRAVELLRTRARLAGIDDAGAAVRLILRDTDAGKNGPWATTGTVSIGAQNALASRSGSRARADMLLTVDAAVHELAHVVQFGRMNGTARPHAAILEGIADTVAMFATGDDTLGEEFFHRDASGRHRGAIRVMGESMISGPALGGVIRTYDAATRKGAEPHAAGGVVSATFAALRTAVGRERAEQLLWAVIRDTKAWSTGGSWKLLAQAIVRQGATIWSGDAAAQDAVTDALKATGLDAALR